MKISLHAKFIYILNYFLTNLTRVYGIWNQNHKAPLSYLPHLLSITTKFMKTNLHVQNNYSVKKNLTSTGPRYILGTNHEKLPLFRVVGKKIVFQNSIVQIFTSKTTIWMCGKEFRNFDHKDWKIITFEVRRKRVFF